MAKVFFGELSDRWRDQTDLTRLEGFSAAVLAAFILVVGLFPFPFINAIDGAVISLLSFVTGL